MGVVTTGYAIAFSGCSSSSSSSSVDVACFSVTSMTPLRAVFFVVATQVLLAWAFVAVKSSAVVEGHNDPTTYDGEDRGGVLPAVLSELPSLEGKVVAVTGCTTGMGLQVASAAVRLRCRRLILVNRPSDRALEAEQGLRRLADRLAAVAGGDVLTTSTAAAKTKKESLGLPGKKKRTKTEVVAVPCDLLSLASVRRAGGEIASAVASLGGLDVLCCNAGIFCGEDLRTPDGACVRGW
jgi:hypothetical protein